MARFVVVLGSSLALAACATTAGRSPAVPSSEPQARVVIVERARAMLGQPYRYGGAAPGGFDCSGLVTYAADGAGIRLPRTAAEQYRAGTPIARANIEAGDLVFMRLTHKDMHVGIAIDADRFIHAPATGRRVRIDSLGAPPYAHAFLAARRIVAPPARGAWAPTAVAPGAAAPTAVAIQSGPAFSPVH